MLTPANDVIEPERKFEVSQDDLAAYVRGDLDRERRARIEGYLACNPDLAAEVMTALHMQGRALNPPGRRRWSASRWRAASVVLGAFLVGSLVWSLSDEALEQHSFATGARAAPIYVNEAVMSQKATMIRKRMISQVETPKLDAKEIQRTMNLRLPAMPENWQIMDVQVYPSDDGPSVNLLIETPSGAVNLFAVRADTPADEKPSVVHSMGEDVAYWEIGDSAYALTGDGPRAELLARAAELSRKALL